METPQFSHDDERQDAAKKPRETRRNASVVLIAVVVLVVGAICSSSGNLSQLWNKWGGGDEARSNSLAADMPGSYVSKDDLCDAVDFAQYEQTVGMKPKVDPDRLETGSGPDEAQCSLTSGDGDAAISDHTLDMSASLHDSRGTADAVYKRLQGEEQWGNEAVSGPWEEAILGSDDDTYALIVRDENAVVIVYQGVDPFDGLKADAAEELMTAYAQQILEYLHE